MNIDPIRKAWAVLSRMAMGPHAPLVEFIAEVGPEEAVYAMRHLTLPAALHDVGAVDAAAEQAEADLRTAEHLGIRLITPDDDEWPKWRMLAFNSNSMRNEKGGAAPLALWARGSGSLSALTESAVAVVGTRAPTVYGERVTREIVSELGFRGATTVSGAAFGIDAVAHRAAISVESSTIAVLGCGIDVPYPVAHQRLLDAVAESGLVVSEYPPGVGAAKYRFLARNRLIAALSEAVVIPEAGRRSGARNTAKWARRMDRLVLAVPGSIESACSVGCHEMVRAGEACLVASPRDVVDELERPALFSARERTRGGGIGR